MDLAANKRALRRRARARGSVSNDAAQRAAAAAVGWVARGARFESAQRVALFAALADEIPTRPVFDAVRASGRVCLFPRCADDGSLDFAPVAAWSDLEPGASGALEPSPGVAAASLLHSDLVFVPGLAFDREGGRLGRGRGAYDRALLALGDRMPFLCGLAYAFQIVERVPMDQHDVRVEAVVTEEGWLDVRRKAGR